MIPVQHCVSNVLTEALRRQPLTRGKLAFCWRLAVGPTVDRATRVSLGSPGEVIVEVGDPHWRREVERAMPVVRNRLEFLLGAAVVSRIVVRPPTRPTP